VGGAHDVEETFAGGGRDGAPDVAGRRHLRLPGEVEVPDEVALALAEERPPLDVDSDEAGGGQEALRAR
jgi:hypothetical protein